MAESAARLLAELGRLPIVVDGARCETSHVAIAAYDGGRRPTSTVTVHGAGHAGRGEHVGWTAEAHERFAARVAGVPCGRLPLGRWVGALHAACEEPYDRAALEAAAIDLALRQVETTVFGLTAVAPAPVRYVVSCGRLRDPAAEAERAVELKLDVDPEWSDAVWASLAASRRVAVLNFKGAPGVERAHRALPDVLLEDPAPSAEPWPTSLRRRLSADAPLRSARDLARLTPTPAAVNLKPARMGGVLEALACAAACAEVGIPVYLGGMFEVGVGRAQLWALAALLAPDGPNDVAPLAVPTHRPPRIVVDPGVPGFGG